MHSETDKVNGCPYYDRETIIVGFEDDGNPMFDMCELCCINNKCIGYCLHCGDNSECEVFNEEE